jgi:hypothetical protein
MAMGNPAYGYRNRGRDVVIFTTLVRAAWSAGTQEMCLGQYNEVADALAANGYSSTWNQGKSQGITCHSGEPIGTAIFAIGPFVNIAYYGFEDVLATQQPGDQTRFLQCIWVQNFGFNWKPCVTHLAFNHSYAVRQAADLNAILVNYHSGFFWTIDGDFNQYPYESYGSIYGIGWLSTYNAEPIVPPFTGYSSYGYSFGSNRIDYIWARKTSAVRNPASPPSDACTMPTTTGGTPISDHKYCYGQFAFG